MLNCCGNKLCVNTEETLGILTHGSCQADTRNANAALRDEALSSLTRKNPSVGRVQYVDREKVSIIEFFGIIKKKLMVRKKNVLRYANFPLAS